MNRFQTQILSVAVPERRSIGVVRVRRIERQTGILRIGIFGRPCLFYEITRRVGAGLERTGENRIVLIPVVISTRQRNVANGSPDKQNIEFKS